MKRSIIKLKKSICNKFNAEQKISNDEFIKNKAMIVTDSQNNLYLVITDKVVVGNYGVHYTSRAYSIFKKNDKTMFNLECAGYYNKYPNKVEVDLINIDKHSINPAEAEIVMIKAIEGNVVTSGRFNKPLYGSYDVAIKDYVKVKNLLSKMGYKIQKNGYGDSFFVKQLNAKNAHKCYMFGGMRVVPALEEKEEGLSL